MRNYEIGRGRRYRRQLRVAVRQTREPRLRNLSRSPSSATKVCRGSQCRRLSFVKTIAVAVIGDNIVSPVAMSATQFCENCRRRRHRRQIFVAVRRVSDSTVAGNRRQILVAVRRFGDTAVAGIRRQTVMDADIN